MYGYTKDQVIKREVLDNQKINFRVGNSKYAKLSYRDYVKCEFGVVAKPAAKINCPFFKTNDTGLVIKMDDKGNATVTDDEGNTIQKDAEGTINVLDAKGNTVIIDFDYVHDVMNVIENKVEDGNRLASAKEEMKKYNIIVLNDVTDLFPLVCRMAKKYGLIIDKIKYSNNNIVGFEHPKNGKIILACDSNIDEVRECAKALYDLNAFKGYLSCHSYVELAAIYYHNVIACNKTSIIPPDHRKLMKDCDTARPIISKVIEANELPKEHTIVSLDINGCYRNAFLQFGTKENEDYICFSGFEKYEPYTHEGLRFAHGYYLVTESIPVNNSTVYLCPGPYPHTFLNDLIDEGYGPSIHVSHYIKPRFSLDSNYVSRQINRICEAGVSKNIKVKQVVNNLYGFAMKSFKTTTRGVMCSDEDTAQYTYNNELSINRFPVIKDAADIKYVFSQEIEELQRNNSPMGHQILLKGVIGLIKLYKMFSNEILVGYHTDSVKLAIPDGDLAGFKKRVAEMNSTFFKLEEDKIAHSSTYIPKGRIEVPEPKLDYVPRPWTEIDREDAFSKSCCIYGEPGAGKTFLASQIYKKLKETSDKVMFTAVQHIVVKMHQKHGNESMTLATLLGQEGNDKFNFTEVCKKLREYKTLLIDEFSFVSKEQYALLYRIFKGWRGTQLIFIGDPNQLGAPEVDNRDDPTPICNIMDLPIFRELCGYNKFFVKYDPKTSRFDPQLRELILRMQSREDIYKYIDRLTYNEGRKSSGLVLYDSYICSTNAKRRQYNYDAKMLFDANASVKFSLGTTEEEDLVYSYNTPIICYSNAVRKVCVNVEGVNTLVKHKFTNCSRYLFKGFNGIHVSLYDIIDEKHLLITKEVFLEKDTFGNPLFELSFAYTAHRMQGTTLEGTVCVDPEGMDWRHLYVSVSRAKSLSNLFFDYSGTLRKGYKKKILNEDIGEMVEEDVIIEGPRERNYDYIFSKPNRLGNMSEIYITYIEKIYDTDKKLKKANYNIKPAITLLDADTTNYVFLSYHRIADVPPNAKVTNYTVTREKAMTRALKKSLVHAMEYMEISETKVPLFSRIEDGKISVTDKNIDAFKSIVAVDGLTKVKDEAKVSVKEITKVERLAYRDEVKINVPTITQEKGRNRLSFKYQGEKFNYGFGGRSAYKNEEQARKAAEGKIDELMKLAYGHLYKKKNA